MTIKELRSYYNEYYDNEFDLILKYINENKDILNKWNKLKSCINYSYILIKELKRQFNLKRKDIKDLTIKNALKYNNGRYYINDIKLCNFFIPYEKYEEILNFNVDKIIYESKINRCLDVYNQLKMNVFKKIFKVKDIDIFFNKNIFIYDKYKIHIKIIDYNKLRTILTNN
jgi:hypothetical protein